MTHNPSRPAVSDHAVLRFLERECGVPVEDIRDAIADGCARAHEVVGVGRVSVRIGQVRFQMEGGIVKTALPREVKRDPRQPMKRQKRHEKRYGPDLKGRRRGG